MTYSKFKLELAWDTNGPASDVPTAGKVPFAPLVDVNRKLSGRDFPEEVCFCNHQSSC